jgi:hypothetical protein
MVKTRSTIAGAMTVRVLNTATSAPEARVDAELGIDPGVDPGAGSDIHAILPSRGRARFGPMRNLRLPSAAIPAGAATMLLGRSFLVACLLASASACSKKNDAPRASGIAPGSGGTAAPSGIPPVTGAGSVLDAAGGGTITGVIVLDPGRKGDVTPNDVVYLVARRVPDNPSARGSLVAVKRYTAASFPIEFTLGAADMMFKNGAFEGDLTLAARIDKDGDPMTRRKGDVFGTLGRVKVGSTGVQIKLDQLQKEDESLAGGAAPAGGMPSGHP